MIAGGEKVGELVVFQGPAWGDEELGRRLGDEAVDSYVVAEAVDYVAAEVGILLDSKCRDGDLPRSYLRVKARAADYLQLMKFHHINGQGIDGIDSGEDTFAVLARKTVDEVETDR